MRDDALEQPHHARDHKPEPQQDHQPRQALGHAAAQRLLKILAGGQAAELCIVVAELIGHELCHDLRRQRAAQAVVGVEHGDGVLGIGADALDAVLDQLVRVDIGVGRHENVVECGVFARDDQLLEVDRAHEHAAPVDGVERGDVVGVGGLADQLLHRLAHGHIGADADKVGGHAAADLVLVKRAQKRQVALDIVIHEVDERAALRALEPLEVVRRGRRVEQRQDLELFADAQLLEIGGHVVLGVFEHAGQHRRVEQGVEAAALVPVQQLERPGNVALVVILKLFSQLPGRKVAAQQRRDLALVVRVAVAGGDLRRDVVHFGHIVFLLCAKASGVRGKRA